MFEMIRKHTKIIMIILVVLIVPAFVFVGVDNYFGSASTTVASVAGHDISQTEWDNAQRNYVQQMQAQNPNVDVKLFNSPEAKYQLLMKMVQERVIQKTVQDDYLSASNASLAAALMKIPAIASLKLPNGGLDMTAYRQLLAQNGTTPEIFEASVRNQLNVAELTTGVTASAFVPTDMVNRAMNAFFQQREVQMATFRVSDYESQLNPTEADIQNYYGQHKNKFQAEPSASIEYVALDMDAALQSIKISDADARQYFEQHASKYQPNQTRRVSDIIINVASDATKEAQEKAELTANQVLLKARKNPAAFAALAKEYSTDESGVRGGDLGLVQAGILPKELDEAAFSLKKDGISDVIKTDRGYNILKVTEIHGDTNRVSFESIKDRVKKDMRQEQASKKFASMSDAFSKAVYSNDNGYEDVAKSLGLTIQTVNNIHPVASQNPAGIFTNAKLLETIFNPSAIDRKQNSDVIQVGTHELVSARIVSYLPAHELAFNQVQEQAKQLLIAEKAKELAITTGENALKEWKKNPEEAKLSSVVSISRGLAGKMDPKLIHTIMAADVSTLPSWVGLKMDDGDYTVIKINAITERDKPDQAEQKSQNQQFTEVLAQAELSAYLKNLESGYKVKIKVAKPSDSENSPK